MSKNSYLHSRPLDETPDTIEQHKGIERICQLFDLNPSHLSAALGIENIEIPPEVITQLDKIITGYNQRSLSHEQMAAAKACSEFIALCHEELAYKYLTGKIPLTRPESNNLIRLLKSNPEFADAFKQKLLARISAKIERIKKVITDNLTTIDQTREPLKTSRMLKENLHEKMVNFLRNFGYSEQEAETIINQTKHYSLANTLKNRPPKDKKPSTEGFNKVRNKLAKADHHLSQIASKHNAAVSENHHLEVILDYLIVFSKIINNCEAKNIQEWLPDISSFTVNSIIKYLTEINRAAINEILSNC